MSYEDWEKQSEIIQCIALVAFLIWLSKLTFGGN